MKPVLPAFLLVFLSLNLTACQWAAVDGPWNEDFEGNLNSAVGVEGLVCRPAGDRAVGGVNLRWEDAEDRVVLDLVTGADGTYASASVAPGRYTARLSIGHFFGVRTVRVDEGADTQSMEDLCLNRSRPQVVVFGAESGEPNDAVDRRLSAFGLHHVQLGPSSAGEMASFLSTPQGLSDYELVAVSGQFDYSDLLVDTQGLGGLTDFLAAGGGLYLSGSAHVVLSALEPEAIEVGSEMARAQFVLAELVDPVLVDALGRETIGIPIDSDTPLPLGFGSDWEVAVEGEVELPSGLFVRRPLVARGPLLGGTALYSAVRAPSPEPSDWWRGSIEDHLGSDGNWDGRGGLVDRLLLEL